MENQVRVISQVISQLHIIVVGIQMIDDSSSPAVLILMEQFLSGFHCPKKISLPAFIIKVVIFSSEIAHRSTKCCMNTILFWCFSDNIDNPALRIGAIQSGCCF